MKLQVFFFDGVVCTSVDEVECADEEVEVPLAVKQTAELLPRWTLGIFMSGWGFFGLGGSNCMISSAEVTTAVVVGGDNSLAFRFKTEINYPKQ